MKTHLKPHDRSSRSREGGQILILEFFKPEKLWPKFFYGSFGRFVFPTVGGVLAGDVGAVEQVEGFADQADADAAFAEHRRDVFPPDQNPAGLFQRCGTGRILVGLEREPDSREQVASPPAGRPATPPLPLA